MFTKDKEARRRLEDLEEKFLRLSRDFHSLSLEWENAYDKLKTMMGRVAKRAEILQKEIDGGTHPLSPAEEAIRDDLANAAQPPMGMSPAQQRLNAQILRSRQRKQGVQ